MQITRQSYTLNSAPSKSGAALRWVSLCPCIAFDLPVIGKPDIICNTEFMTCCNDAGGWLSDSLRQYAQKLWLSLNSTGPTRASSPTSNPRGEVGAARHDSRPGSEVGEEVRVGVGPVEFKL